MASIKKVCSSYCMYWLMHIASSITHSREYWTATVNPSACYDSDELNCVLYLSFCHPVPIELGESCYNAAVCQKGFDQDGDVLELNMGSFTNYTHFYKSKLNKYWNEFKDLQFGRL